MSAHKTLIENVEHHYSTIEAEALKDFFNALALPIPEYKEYYKGMDTNYTGKDANYLVFFSPLGIALRILPNEDRTNIVHDRVLQPIGSRIIGNIKIDIMPGVKTNVPLETVDFLMKDIKKDNLIFSDPTKNNIGTLPNGYPVIIDIGAVEKKSGHINASPISLSEQNKCFSTLQKYFDKTWPKEQNSADPDQMKQLIRKCSEMKNKGILVSGWQSSHVKEIGRYVYGPAENYARKIAPLLKPA